MSFTLSTLRAAGSAYGRLSTTAARSFRLQSSPAALGLRPLSVSSVSSIRSNPTVALTWRRHMHSSRMVRNPGSAGSSSSGSPVSSSPLVPGQQQAKAKPQTIYGLWYREIVPAMVPIFLISTAVFLAISLLRTHLSHSRSLSESTERIASLEGQLARLRAEAIRRRERERRERERILPLVVERVLQRVGAMGPEEEIQVDEERLVV